MEQLQEQNKKIQEYRRKVLEKTCTPRELAEAWGISYTKVLRLAKLDDFLEEHIGENLL